MSGETKVLKEFEFVDRQGRIWDLTMTMGAAHLIDHSDYSALSPKKISILNPDKETFSRLMEDSNLLWAVIWTIVQPQVERILGIDPKKDYDKAEQEFLLALDGPAIQRGKTAFWRAVADFFPDQKTALLALLQGQEAAQKELNEEIATMMPDIQQMMSEETKAEIKRLKKQLAELGGRSTESRESADSPVVNGNG